ncbi:histidine phosphatase family protein [Pseudonocardia sp. CA-107938]|uniref:histidine phosphatase family protein n=1 Tax=Pseudonocardia sp. CA-107938 TaxID=3240021 RepID=UPI003D8CD982
MHLVLVRHALPVRVDLAAGRADPGLTELGQQQAERLVAALADPAPVAVYTSTLARAVATAAPLARALGITPTARPDLCEFDAGAGQYVPVHELAAADPATWQRMRSGLLPAHVDAGAFTEQVAEAMEAVVAAHPGRVTVVVVAHAGVINVWLARLLGIDHPLPFPLDYTGITRVVAARDGLRRIRTVNEIGHVADLLEPVPGRR